MTSPSHRARGCRRAINHDPHTCPHCGGPCPAGSTCHECQTLVMADTVTGLATLLLYSMARLEFRPLLHSGKVLSSRPRDVLGALILAERQYESIPVHTLREWRRRRARERL